MESKKIKVVHVQLTPIFAGAVKFSYDILSGLDMNKYELYIIYSDIEPVRLDLKTEFISRFESKGIKTIGLKYLSRKIGLNDISVLFELNSILKKISPQIINSISSKPWVLCSILSIITNKYTFIHTIQGLSWHFGNSWIKRKFYHLLEWTSAIFNKRLVFVNQLYMQYFNFFKLKSLYIPNCMEFRDINSINNNSKEDIHLLFIGRIDPQKDLLTLLKAFNIVIQRSLSVRVYLHIVGDDTIGGGEEKLKVYKFIEENPTLVNLVKFHGWHSNIKPFLENADIFVTTSIYEGFGIVFLEAGNYNIPVIATDVDGIPEVVVNGHGGLLAKKRDFVKIAINLEKLILDKKLRLEMGNFHGKYVREKFSKDLIVAKYDDLYTTMVIKQRR